MKKVFLSLIVIVAVLFVSGCGKTNELVGTWNGDTNDGLNTTFEFKKGDKVSYLNEYGITSEGTYKIKDDIVTIDLKSWSEAKNYKFTIKKGKLSLTAQDSYSPSYTNMIKK